MLGVPDPPRVDFTACVRPGDENGLYLWLLWEDPGSSNNDDECFLSSWSCTPSVRDTCSTHSSDEENEARRCSVIIVLQHGRSPGAWGTGFPSLGISAHLCSWNHAAPTRGWTGLLRVPVWSLMTHREATSPHSLALCCWIQGVDDTALQ